MESELDYSVAVDRLTDTSSRKRRAVGVNRGDGPMRDDTSSRWVSARNSPRELSLRDYRPVPYGPAIAIGLSIAAWSVIAGAVLLLL